MIFTGKGSTWCIEYEMHGECFVVWRVKSVLSSCGEN